MVKVGIAGGGRGAVLLLNYLSFDKDVKVVGIFDLQAGAPGVLLARQMGIDVMPSLEALATRPDVDALIEVTGSEEVREKLFEAKADRVQLIDSSAARFFIERIRAASDRSLEAANTVRLRFDEIGASLAQGIALIQEALVATEEIAGQTEVLSINAAIEAARAPGESGRTFGVVANEIQRVAQTTKKTTKHVGEILQNFSDQADGIRRLAEEMVATLKASGV